MIHTVYTVIECQWAHLQPTDWVDEGDGNDGQTECQYNDGKETKRCMASSEAADIAIDVPALQSRGQIIKYHMKNEARIMDRDFQNHTMQ